MVAPPLGNGATVGCANCTRDFSTPLPVLAGAGPARRDVLAGLPAPSIPVRDGVVAFGSTDEAPQGMSFGKGLLIGFALGWLFKS